MSGFNLLHLVTKSQPVALRSCSLPSGARRTKKTWPVTFPQEELRKRLTPMQYHVTQERGTESAFTGELAAHKDEGTYACVVCGAPLFSSNTKFDSGSGWPSFFDVVKEESVSLSDDFSYGMHRVETPAASVELTWVTCSRTGPGPRGSATASTRPRSTSSPQAEVPPPLRGRRTPATGGRSSEGRRQEPDAVDLSVC